MMNIREKIKVHSKLKSRETLYARIISTNSNQNSDEKANITSHEKNVHIIVQRMHHIN
jgi:hypothetical protein